MLLRPSSERQALAKRIKCLGPVNNFSASYNGKIRLLPREGKVDAFPKTVSEMVVLRHTCASNLDDLIGSMFVLIVNCFGKVAMGGF